MRILSAIVLASAALVSEAVGTPWYRLTALPPLNLLPAHPPMFPFTARLIVLAALGGVAWLAVELVLQPVAVLLARNREPRWAAMERLSRLIDQQEGQTVLLWGVLILAVVSAFVLLIPGLHPDRALPAALAAWLGYTAFHALHPAPPAGPGRGVAPPAPVLQTEDMAEPLELWGREWRSTGFGTLAEGEDELMAHDEDVEFGI